MATKPCGVDGDDVAGVVPALGRRLEHARVLGAEIAEHDVRPAHVEPAAVLDARHRLEPRLHAGHEPADRAEAVEHRRVDGEHRRRLGDAVAFEDAQAELLHVDPPRRLLDRLGAGEDVAQRAEVVGVRRARVAGEEGVGAEQDRGVRAVDQLRHDPVVQRRGIEIDAHAGDERQHEADRQAEGVEHRQHVEHLVAAAEIDARRGLRGVRQHVAVGEHDALRRAFRARGEQDRGRVVRACAATSGFLNAARPRSLSSDADAGRARPRDRRCAPSRASAPTSGSSFAFSTKAREVTMVVDLGRLAGGEDVGGAGREVDHRRHAAGRHRGRGSSRRRRWRSAA